MKKDAKEASRLAAFLLALQLSPTTQTRYERDPAREMRRFHLSRAAIKAVQNRNYEALWRILSRPGTHVGVATGTEKKGGRGRKPKPPVPPHVASVVGVRKSRRRRKRT